MDSKGVIMFKRVLSLKKAIKFGRKAEIVKGETESSLINSERDLNDIRRENERRLGLTPGSLHKPALQSKMGGSSVGDWIGHPQNLTVGNEQSTSKDQKQMKYEYLAGSEIDKRAFTGNLEACMRLALTNNRMDVIQNLSKFARELTLKSEPDLSPELALKKIEESFNAPDTTPELLAEHPKPPKTLLNIHEQCLKTFVEAKSGHTFTGLVHILPDGKYKMFLAPIQPSEGTEADTSKGMEANPNKKYLGRQHNSSSSIYGKEVQPLYHLKAIGENPPREGHAQLGEHIKSKPKHQADKFEEGKFIGFTVIKGCISDGLSNKYVFVSQRSNPYTFRQTDGKPGDSKVPAKWQRVIGRTLDAVSVIEYTDEMNNFRDK